MAVETSCACLSWLAHTENAKSIVGPVNKTLGSPRKDDPKLLASIRKLWKQKVGILKIAKQLGVGTSTVQRIFGALTSKAE